MMLRIDEDRFPVFGRLIWRWRKRAPGNGRAVSAVGMKMVENGIYSVISFLVFALIANKQDIESTI
jgi:hypothetical protein